MTEPLLVSVVVPAWNSEATLQQTLESAAKQTYRAIEIVIVDDGSTDSTPAIAEAFCVTDERARLVRKDNGGLSSARNRGIAEARGEWVAPLDADDLWHPTKLDKQIAVALGSDLHPSLVYCWYRVIDEQSHVIGSGPRLCLRGHVFHQLAYMNAVENGSGLLLSRKAAIEVGGYDERLAALEDVMLQLRIANRFTVDLVPEHLVGWRRHSSNMSGDADLVERWTKVVYDQLAGEGFLANGETRLVAARDAFNTAEQRAARGQLARAALCLGRSIAWDFARNSLQLLYRCLRSVCRHLHLSNPKQVPSLFFEVDPAAEIYPDPFALPRIKALIDGLDRMRLRRMAKLDTKYGSRSSPLT